MAEVASKPNTNLADDVTKDPPSTAKVNGTPRDIIRDSSSSPTDIKLAVKWNRSTLYNAIILGICNFLAPGIWGGKAKQDPCRRSC